MDKQTAVDRGLRLAPLLLVAAKVVHPLARLLGKITRPQYTRYCDLPNMTWRAYYLGQHQRASDLALELINTAESLALDSNYGDAIDAGHQVLGLLCLDRGDMEGAVRHLNESSQSKGSPVLKSRGPVMRLARRLAESGQKEAVLEYIESVSRYWLEPQPLLSKYEWYRHSLDDKKRRFESWRADLEIGKIPTDPNWAT